MPPEGGMPPADGFVSRRMETVKESPEVQRGHPSLRMTQEASSSRGEMPASRSIFAVWPGSQSMGAPHRLHYT